MLGDPEDYIMMSDREKYLYDLQGFLVVEQFLTQDEVRKLNEAVDANEDKRSEREVIPLDGTALQGSYSTFQFFHNMLTWEKPWCQPFRDLIAHPRLLPYLNTMFGRGWKIDHVRSFGTFARKQG